MSQSIIKIPTGVYLALLAALITLEVLLISTRFDARSLLYDQHTGSIDLLLTSTGDIAKIGVVVLCCLLLFLWPRRNIYWLQVHSGQNIVRVAPWALVHVLMYIAFYFLSQRIFASTTGAPYSLGLAALWFASGLVVCVSWLLCLAPFAFWQAFLRAEKYLIGLALLAGTATWLFSLLTQSLWDPLSDATFFLSAQLLSQLYTDVIIDPQLKNLGTPGFVVNIAPACSGYEGIGLITVFTAVYLYLYRQDFRFPWALCLFPLGIAAIWLFNILRIVILIAIGSSYSPEVAVGGFHSQAGWISFILVSSGILLTAQKLTFFSRHARVSSSQQAHGGDGRLAAATLIPFAALLLTTLITQAFSADFMWLYPVRVVITAAAIAYCWKTLQLPSPRWRAEPVFWGCLVFVCWVLMVPVDTAEDRFFESALDQVPPIAALAWLIVRFLGAVVTVPIAEELAFRGYLLARLARSELSLVKAPRFSWFALLLSSLIFGMLHGAWAAGVLAGAIYALVRFRGQHIGDAIIAHAVTNLLLSLYVLTTGQWSAW